MAEYGSRGKLCLLDEILGECPGCTKQLPAATGTTLGQIGCGQDQVSFGDQVVKRLQFAGGWLCHIPTVRSMAELMQAFAV